MAFTKCKECGGNVHSKRNICVRCGASGEAVELHTSSVHTHTAESTESSEGVVTENLITEESVEDERPSSRELITDRSQKLRGRLEQHERESRELLSEEFTPYHEPIDTKQEPEKEKPNHHQESANKKPKHPFRVSRDDEQPLFSPFVKQALLTSIFLFVMFLVYEFGKNYLRSLQIQQTAQRVAELKLEELDNSWNSIFVPDLYTHTSCKEWSEYHADKEGMNFNDRYNHYKWKCRDKGHY